VVRKWVFNVPLEKKERKIRVGGGEAGAVKIDLTGKKAKDLEKKKKKKFCSCQFQILFSL